MDVILDVDTGVDDALALLFALRASSLRVRAVTCVAGNVAVGQVVANTLKLLDAAGAVADLPVGRGPESDLPADVRGVHGEDGMADLGLPLPARQIAGTADAVLRDALSAGGPVTLLALGPLTNVAAVLADAGLRERIERIVAVGGPELEFNVAYDPGAAHDVERSSVPVIRYGAGSFFGTTVAEPDIERLAAAADPAAVLAGRLLRHQAERFGPDAATIGDAGAVALVLDPEADATARTKLFLDALGG